MTLEITDADVKRILKRLAAADAVVFFPKRFVVRADGGTSRGCAGTIGRGRTLVKLPDEHEPRELRAYELEALCELARAGAVGFAALGGATIGLLGGPGAAALPALELEDGRVVAPGEADHPTQAFAV